DLARATDIVQALFLAHNQRIRLFDRDGQVLIDSYLLAGRIEQRPLPPPRKPGEHEWRWPWEPQRASKEEALHVQALADLQREVRVAATRGETVAEVRLADRG
ncbi:stimulus-sensing domain-containing protein, partial [Mycobacterium tuberculosis]